MARYRVGFFNEIPDSTGHDHHVCQREIEVVTDDGEDRAIADAILQFEHLERVSSWGVHARTIECHCVDSQH